MVLRTINIGLIGLLIALATGCGEGGADDAIDGSFLYLGVNPLGQPYRYGDLLTFTKDRVKITGSFSGRDTTVNSIMSDPRTDQGKWIGIGAGPTLSEDYLVAEPFVYRMDSVEYWSSFEPSFTGFPEFARPDANDFINRMAEWDGLAPGLEYTEYVLRQVDSQSVLLISERLRGQYVNTFAVIVDTLDDRGFGGRLISQGGSGDATAIQRIRFDRTSGIDTRHSVGEFVDIVNQGFSRSYLLFPPSPIPDTEMSKAGQRLPRRALIDASDPGRISASFLDDGTFMLLTDDKVALEGNYTLDLDKGLLTVDDGKTTTFRIFVGVEPKISFTLPVSVLSLAGTKMVGTDNYLRIELVR